MAHVAGTGAIIGLPHQQQGRSTDDGKTRGGGSADHGRDRSLRTKMPSACPAPVSDRPYGRRRCQLPGERPALLRGGKSSLVPGASGATFVHFTLQEVGRETGWEYVCREEWIQVVTVVI